jgi:hypothetical protein
MLADRVNIAHIHRDGQPDRQNCSGASRAPPLVTTNVASFAKSLSLSSVSLSGRPSNRKRNRADAALYIERILDTH